MTDAQKLRFNSREFLITITNTNDPRCTRCRLHPNQCICNANAETHGSACDCEHCDEVARARRIFADDSTITVTGTLELDNAAMERVLLANLSRALQRVLINNGVQVPEGKKLVMHNASIDTDYGTFQAHWYFIDVASPSALDGEDGDEEDDQ